MLRLLSSLPLSQAANDAPYNRAFKRMLILSTFLVMVPVPVSVLVFLYVQFRPFQSATEYFIMVAIGVDMFLVWCFWPRIYAIMNDTDQNSCRTSQGLKSFLGILSSGIREASIRFTIRAPMTTLVRALMSTVTPKVRTLVKKMKVQSVTLMSKAAKGCAILGACISRRVVWNGSMTLSLVLLCVLVSNPEIFHIRDALDLQNKRLYSNPEVPPSEACSETRNSDKSLGLNLRNRSFRKANLSGAYLCNAILESAQLQGAIMRNSHLQGADLTKAHLEGADLRNARMQGVSMSQTQLQGANMRSTGLQGARLNWYTDLQRADLTDAQLQGADLRRAQLRGTVLRRAQLQGADLTGAELQGAVLWDAQLQGADLQYAGLQGADLGRTQVQGANLNGARLEGVVSYRGFQELRRVDVFQRDEAKFADTICRRVNKESEISEITFVGGLSQTDVDAAIVAMGGYVSEARIERFAKDVHSHIGTEGQMGILPPESGAILGEYDESDANQWIGHSCDAGT